MASLPDIHTAPRAAELADPVEMQRKRPEETRPEPVLTRACPSDDPNCLPTLDVQVQPIENEGSVVPVSHLIVSECDLPTAGPVMGTRPHFERLSAFWNTGLKSRRTDNRLDSLTFSFISFLHSHSSRSACSLSTRPVRLQHS